MARWQIGFEYPYFLLLLLILPVIWWLGFHSLAGLGPVRRALALIFRSLVISLIVLALAGIQWIWISDRLTVIYLLDQSDSIPQPKRQLMLQFAIESVKQHRNPERKDRAGLIVFGRESSIEFPPLDDNLPPIKQAESYRGKTDATNLESALKLAQACFPEDTARRVVVITDGNETLGAAASVAQSLTTAGIGIDVVPVRLESNAEVLVEKIDIPGSVRQGQPVDAKIVIHRYAENGQNTPVEGNLRVTRRIGNRTEVLADEAYTLEKDVNVVSIPHKIELPAGYTYEAEFIPSKKSDDAIAQNNRSTAFTYARGKGRVLLIEDSERLGEFDLFVEALRRNDIEVEVRDNSQLFSSLIELQAYDSVILAGVPRTSGEAATEVASFTDDQIEMLVTNTQQFGSGILMLGGPEAFGAGGWSNTKLEEAMPVDFQIRNSKIEAVGALAMVMHASEIPEGNYWQKIIAKSALEVLGPMDYCGVLQFDALGDKWMWGGKDGMLRVGQNRQVMRSRLMRMTPGDMPDFDPSMQMALASLKSLPAAMKHMIIISDGDPTPASNGVLNGFANAGIKISTVAVGAHGPAGHQELQRIANTTGGTYYVVTNPQALPKIFQREARRVAKPLIYEPEGGDSPELLFRHETLQGIENFPSIRGYVLTQLKESSLVEVPLRMPRPSEKENATLLATWTYGLGRTAVFTSDAGKRWTTSWLNSPQYDQFFSQLVRWTMRPSADEGKYQIATNVRDGKVQVIVSALDQDDRFLNFLEMSGVAVSPDLKPVNLGMRQVAPGRYVGEFDATSSGSYMVSVMPGPGQAPLTTGVTVPFSDEYRVRQANMNLLEGMANLTVTGGGKGEIGPAIETETLKELLAQDPYRGGLPPSKSLKDIWPWALLVGATLFFCDVFVRRVALDLGVPIRWLAMKLRPKTKAADVQRMARLDQLKSQKTAIGEGLEKQRAAAQFTAESETDQAAPSALDAFSASTMPTAKSTHADEAKPTLQQSEDNNYTSRLLEAKRKAQKKNLDS